MTSFGVEFDTTALVYIPGGNLPEGVIEKTPAVGQGSWTLSLEGTNPAKKRSGDSDAIPTGTDCLYSVEAQMGVFRSPNEKTFNIDAFIQTCSEFKTEWEEMMTSHTITIANKPYDLLTYINHMKTAKGDEFYVDCARSTKGSHEGKDDTAWSYMNNLKSVKGKPQLTIGIKLKYVTSLFKGIVGLFKTCDRDTNGCPSVPNKESLVILEKVIDISTKQLVYLADEGILQRTPNLDSVIMLTNYILYILVYLSNLEEMKSYVKAWYAIKLRSNLRVIFDDILTETEQTNYHDWAVSLGGEEFRGYVDPRGIVDIWFNSFFTEKVYAYRIKAVAPTTDLRVPMLGIFHVETEQLRSLSDHVQLERIAIDKGYSNRPPELKLISGADGRTVLAYDNIDDITGFDLMEWGATGDTVYLELRGLMAIFSLGRDVKTGVYKDLTDHNGGMTATALCPFIKFVVKSVLEPAIQIDPGLH